MASRRKINLHWRLFIPIATIMCLVVGILVTTQYNREADYRAEVMQKELSLINNRILYAYAHDQNMRSFISFIQQYYKGSMFAGIRVSVYDKDGMLLYNLGTPIPRDVQSLSLADVNTDDTGVTRGMIYDDDNNDGNARPFYYSSTKSDDGQIDVRTSMPYNDAIVNAVGVDNMVWLMVFLLVVAVLVITYYSTRLVTRNVELLRKFATRAAKGDQFNDMEKFPHNELGDISREIITLYRERGRALEAAKRERRVSVHAIEEKALAAKQITNNINHEIKTPLGIIKGYMETIMSDPDMPADQRNHFLQRMNDSVARLDNLLNDVSTMTRLEDGGEKVQISKVDMHDLVYQIDADLPASKLAGKLEFSYDLPLDCKVRGNFTLINGLIGSLLRNASMHSGGTEAGLKMVSDNGKFYVFSFWDNGQGVDQEHLARLFDRFYRVDSGRSRKMGGTGLGLAIVKSTIVALGGTISAHNRSTGGLEFTFTLPKWTEKE